MRQAATDAGRDPDSLRFVCRVALGGPVHGLDSPLSGSYPRIRQGTAWLAEQGVTELFYDPNFDPTIVGSDVPPDTALTAVTVGWALIVPPFRAVRRTTEIIAAYQTQAGVVPTARSQTARTSASSGA